VLNRIVTPIVWRIPGHPARKLAGFARAEQGSRIDLMQAAHLTTSPERRAAYLRHAMDETRHARMFWRRARELADAPLPAPQADSEDLFARLGEARFLAFVHRGEKRGRAQFEVYARHFLHRGDARTGSLFGAILQDELRHESYTLELLVQLVGAKQARVELRRAALWEAWRTWRRAGRALANLAFVVAMTVIYLVAAPLTWLATRRKRRNRWSRPDGEIEQQVPVRVEARP
jgi:hypothetical protein